MFLIEFDYHAPPEAIEAVRGARDANPDSLFARGLAVVAGPLVGRAGELIIAEGSHSEVEACVASDPLVTGGLAMVRLTEFRVVFDVGGVSESRPPATSMVSVRYGSHPEQVAEVNAGAAAGRVPLVLLFHGGFWRAVPNRRQVAAVATALAASGYVVANVEYRRLGHGDGWPSTFVDAARAVDALPGLIEAEMPGRIDHDRVVCLGHGSGAQLALWAAAGENLPPDAPRRAGTPTRVAGVLALAPASDLVQSYRLGSGDGAVAELLGGGPDEVPERYAAVDPVTLGTVPCRVVVVHGDQDGQLPVRMSRQYCARVSARLVELAGVGHLELIDPASAAWPHVTRALRDIATPGSPGVAAPARPPDQ